MKHREHAVFDYFATWISTIFNSEDIKFGQIFKANYGTRQLFHFCLFKQLFVKWFGQKPGYFDLRNIFPRL